MNDKFISYKEKYTFEERCERAKSMKEKYPQKIPIVLVPEKSIVLKSCQFLVDSNISFMQFISLVRKNYAIELKSYEAIFCLVNKILPPGTSMLFEIYNQYQEPDGILYVHIKKESTFG
jgi:hypothetical protein